MYLSEVQLEKALFPIFVTLLGISIEVSEVQLEKVPLLMLVTLLGISIEVSEVQLWKAQEAITRTPLNKSDVMSAIILDVYPRKNL